MVTDADRRILAAIHLPRAERSELAVELGMSPTRLYQRMLWLSRQPYAVAAMPVECGMIQRARQARPAVRPR